MTFCERNHTRYSSSSRYLSLAHMQLDADVATTISDYDYYILIGMVKAQYYRYLPRLSLTTRSGAYRKETTELTFAK